MALKLRKLKTIFVTIGLASVIVGFKDVNTPRNTKEASDKVSDEVSDETSNKEKFIKDLRTSGIVLTQECGTEFYRIDKSSANGSSNITNYFEEKFNIPTYDIKCSPYDLTDLISTDEAFSEIATFQLVAIINLNDNIESRYVYNLRDAVQSLYGRAFVQSNPLLGYNLTRVTVKEVRTDEDYISKFDPVECCIYINLAKIKTTRDRKFAYELAVKQLSRSGYLNINGKRVYCSLTNFYYDSVNNKIIEVGKMYDESFMIMGYRMCDKFIGYCPQKYEDYALYYIITDILNVGPKKECESRRTPKDFSERLNEIFVKDKKTESEVSDVMRMLINLESGYDPYECAKDAIEYFYSDPTIYIGGAEYCIDHAVSVVNQNILDMQLIVAKRN